MTAGRQPAAMLAAPRARLALGLAGVAASAVLARRDRVGTREEMAFRRVNGLPDGLFPAVWPVMQLGNLAAAPVAAAVASKTGHRSLATRLLLAGSSSWALSKAVKRGVGRPRPAALLPGTHCRGREQTGYGYLSGHAAVATALGVATFPHLRWRGRLPALAAVPVVGLCRLYVGAHLPLDVVGGASMGLAVEAAMALRSARPITAANPPPGRTRAPASRRSRPARAIPR